MEATVPGYGSSKQNAPAPKVIGSGALWLNVAGSGLYEAVNVGVFTPTNVFGGGVVVAVTFGVIHTP